MSDYKLFTAESLSEVWLKLFQTEHLNGDTAPQWTNNRHALSGNNLTNKTLWQREAKERKNICRNLEVADLVTHTDSKTFFLSNKMAINISSTCIQLLKCSRIHAISLYSNVSHLLLQPLYDNILLWFTEKRKLLEPYQMSIKEGGWKKKMGMGDLSLGFYISFLLWALKCEQQERRLKSLIGSE